MVEQTYKKSMTLECMSAKHGAWLFRVEAAFLMSRPTSDLATVPEPLPSRQCYPRGDQSPAVNLRPPYC